MHRFSKILCMTCDVEVEQEEDLDKLEQILQVFDTFRLKGTFFLLFKPRNYSLFESSDLLAHLDGHELGLHIHWGQGDGSKRDRIKCLASLPVSALHEEMETSLNYCRRLGFRPVSFRGGGLSQTTHTLGLISKSGFAVDSSVAPKLSDGTWRQDHFSVPYKSWYFPSMQGYQVPAEFEKERIGILEVPVTRLIPSFRGWFPYTLAPGSPLFKVIINEWLFRSRWEKPLVITPIIHSYGITGKEDFRLFLKSLTKSLEYLLKKHLSPFTLRELRDLLTEENGG